MKLINFGKSAIAVVVFGALVTSTCTNAATPASDVELSTGMDLETAYHNTQGQVDGLSSDVWNNIQDIKTNSDAIATKANTTDVVKSDAELAHRIADNKTAITSNTDELKNVASILDSHDHVMDNHETRIDALENQPKPKDGVDGKNGVDGATGAQGAKGDKGDKGDSIKGDTGATGSNGANGKDGKNGVTTTITKVDTATRKKVEDQGAKLLSTSKAVFDNHQAISKMNNTFSSLKDTVDSNRKEANAGVSGAMAQANIPQVMNNQTFAIGAAVGGYESENAVAVGASARLSDSVVVKASVSDDTQSNIGYGAGIAIGF